MTRRNWYTAGGRPATNVFELRAEEAPADRYRLLVGKGRMEGVRREIGFQPRHRVHHPSRVQRTPSLLFAPCWAQTVIERSVLDEQS